MYEKYMEFSASIVKSMHPLMHVSYELFKERVPVGLRLMLTSLPCSELLKDQELS